MVVSINKSEYDSNEDLDSNKNSYEESPLTASIHFEIS